MNPFYQSLLRNSTPVQSTVVQSAPPIMNGPIGVFQGVLQRARQIASGFQNPQQLVRQCFPDAPAEVAGDPDQLVNWLQQSGRVNPQMVQMARQILGR